MIKHIVMFKLKDKESAVTAKEKALKLIDLVPSITDMKVEINSENAPDSNFELALICDFKDMDALNAYQTHPEHLEFGKYISEIRTARACIDYEY